MKLAKRMEALKASEIREILKLTQNPEIISFAGGLPAPELFPVEDYAACAKAVYERMGQTVLQYSTTEGHAPLREKIAGRMKRYGASTKKENILITAGSQQGLDFSGKIFLDEGDVVIVESPSYLGAINAFKAYAPRFIEVTTDDEGMVMEELEAVLKQEARAKFIYVIPDFQNPSGKTWSVERRKRLVALANQYDVVIVEDSPYGEVRYEGEILPYIRSFDTEGRVVYLGTFSKTFAPGLRIGWVEADEFLIDKYIKIKQGADLQTATDTQVILDYYLEHYDLDAHIEKIVALYRTRRDLMIDSMKEYFPQEVTFTVPEGGLFTWVSLPEHLDAREVFKKCLEKKVAMVPGSSFYPNGNEHNHFRMNYSNMTEERIVEGVKLIGEVLHEVLK